MYLPHRRALKCTYLILQNIHLKQPSKRVYVSALLQHKENFKEMDAQESQRLVRGQKDRLDYEVRKFRRRRLVQYHDLEQDLLREVRHEGWRRSER